MREFVAASGGRAERLLAARQAGEISGEIEQLLGDQPSTFRKAPFVTV